MNIEIHQPRLEALIHEGMATGRFESVEDLLLTTLEALQEQVAVLPAKPEKQNMTRFLQESPLWGSGLVVERQRDFPPPVEL